jgi:Tol biopolymer transport system component
MRWIQYTLLSPDKHKKPFSLKHIFLLVSILLISLLASGQFYNGHQMNFGKNRVQYREFLWQFYRFDKFDTYFYVNGAELAEYAAEIANQEIPAMENFFQHPLEKRILFLIYNKISDFKQSNISYISQDEDNNIGGMTQIINNKVFLYFEGDREKFRQQIKGAIAEVMLNEMLYGSSFTERLANSTLLTTPPWYQSGLKSYLSTSWNPELEDQIRDGVLSGKYEKINQLSGDQAMYAGHSIWSFVSREYGKAVIPNIVYLTRIHKNADQGFLYMLGTEFDVLANEWLYQLKKKYESESKNREPVVLDHPQVKSKRNAEITDISLNSDGQKLAWVVNRMGKYSIYIHDTGAKKTKKIFTKGNKLRQISDFSQPLLAWHPSNQLLAFIVNLKGKNLLYLYNLETNKLEFIQLFYFENISDFSYADDGMSIVLSATIKGHSDIYVHSLISKTNQQITNDYADDFNPRFIEKSSKIIFASNRKSDKLNPEAGPEIETNLTSDLFIYDLKSKDKQLQRLTNTPLVNERKPYEVNRHEYLYTSDESGITNIALARFDSVIAFIDTTTHYAYQTKTQGITNHTNNLSLFEPATNLITAEVFTRKQRDYLLIRELDTKSSYTWPQSEDRQFYIRQLQQKDSLEQQRLTDLQSEIEKSVKQKEALFKDSLLDFNKYVFEIEKTGSIEMERLLIKQQEKSELKVPRARMYFTSFYTNSLVNQVDFSFLNASYQAYTGGAVYYNPGFNFLFKAGVNDLFEDYRLTGAVRVSSDFQSGEYLISVENLRNRLDEQYIFHRQSFKEVGTSTANKNISHELMYIRKYPFSQVDGIKGTLSLRHDNIVQLSTDNSTARAANIQKIWSGLKFEYIFDNTHDLALNIKSGTRLKIFTETYFKLGEKFSDMHVIGLDFRNYLPIHRELIWASRFAASTNFGRSRLIYYMGSLDNWMSFLTADQVFDGSVAVDKTQNFEYQTLATNMRGFAQNIRNGNSFFVFNNEIRFPFVRYFWRKPISSDFLSNLQLATFFDFGTAWSGNSLYALNNAYNYVIASNGPVTVVLNKDINPFVYGYGWGLRTRLFGYFIRADWAWGVEDQIIQPRMFYISLNLDF